MAAFTIILFTSSRMSREVYGQRIINDRDPIFLKIDTSGDGAININEFQKATMLENEYEIFNMNDSNNDELISVDEYQHFSKYGPVRLDGNPSNMNFNSNRQVM